MLQTTSTEQRAAGGDRPRSGDHPGVAFLRLATGPEPSFSVTMFKPGGILLVVSLWALSVVRPAAAAMSDYFPPPESQGGWRTLETPEDIRRLAGADPDKLAGLKQWLLDSDERDFAAVVIRRGYIALEVERGNSAKTDSRRVASVSKAICATVLAIAAERSRLGG